MKVALQVWIIASLTECLLYSIFVEPALGLFVIPFALLGALPGVFLFWFSLEAFHTLLESGYKKWLSIAASAFVCANGTLLLFLLIIDFGVDDMPVWLILNLAVAVAFLSTIPLIKKHYFTIEEKTVWDADKEAKPYQFQNYKTENHEKN